MRNVNLKSIILIILVIALLGAFLFIYQFLRQNVNLSAFTSQAEIVDVDLPPGFEMNIFAKELDGPRFIAFGPKGDLYVAERGAGRITRLPDEDQDGVADRRVIFQADLDRPHSIVYQQGSWFVGVPTGIIRLDDNDQTGSADDKSVIVDDIPGSGQHTTRTVAFIPDGRMLLSVGSSCNSCVEEDPRRAAIVVYENAQGEGGEIFARGLRNAVGLTIQPDTNDVWATNNARDLMGDDIPPDSLHRVEQGQDYGWPSCHAGQIPDPDLGGAEACQGVPKPALQIQAHSAPLGLVFYDGSTFPVEYMGGLFIAYHGSWNRTDPTGYKVVFAPFEDSLPNGEIKDFATGWLDPETEEVYGRPVGLAVGPDGALYVSDDKAGVIYRIQYRPD
ncbi:MAG: PQQ-dependent sugar dehydrogenase [Anaerolineales bacterium]|jgi:glucose/arabinose dehydrogenase